MTAFDEIAKLNFTPEEMTPLHWVIWNSRASLPLDLLEQAAQQLQRLTPRAADVCHKSPSGDHLWQLDGNSKYCIACGKRR